MHHMFQLLHRKNGAPCLKGLVGNINQQGEALGEQLALSGKEMSDGLVQVDPEG